MAENNSTRLISKQLNPTLVRIVCISDLHSLQLPSSLPPGDILIVAGDLTEGRPSYLLSRLEELQGLTSQFLYILVVGGNHDRALDEKCDPHDTAIYNDIEERVQCRAAFRTASGINYLENNGVEIYLNRRTVKVWGSPGSLATTQRTCFGYTAGKDAQDLWAQIPADTNILITHGPPLGYMDKDGLGCEDLRKALWRIEPLAHVFGHVHEGHGSLVLRYDQMQKEYEAAVSDWKAITENQTSGSVGIYIPRHLRLASGPPFPRLPERREVIKEGLLDSQQETLLVNASIKSVPPFDPVVIQI
jgi:Icc-related predicted phosphoesterase